VTRTARWARLGAIALGGALGSAARHGLALALPTRPGGIPWDTATANLAGSFLLGLLMVHVLEVWPPTRFVRPFLGVGLLGGFTTFSAFTVETQALLQDGRYAVALGYVAGTVVLGLAAVWAGVAVGRASAARPAAGRESR
jgi:fluoride exporter